MERVKDKKGEEQPMNENLSQMVRENPTEEVVFSESDLDLPIEEVTAAGPETDATADQQPSTEATTTIPVGSLASWFEANSEQLENINQVKVAIRGVDADKTLIMAVKDDDGEQDADGNDKRTLRVFDNADNVTVLNIPPMTMDVYNNGFRIVYHYNDVFIKTYGVRTGLICTLCTAINGKLIPYTVVRVKKKDEDLVLPDTQPEITPEKLAEDADLESLQLLYKQSAKAVDDLSTNQSVIDWLVDRQETVTDINHHLQIDNVIIEMLK